MMSQSLATYPLLQCVVAAAQFASGEITFYDAYAELMAADAEGSRTSPLRIFYDVLEHFRIVRAQRVMRLTLPAAEVHRWAEQNGFASQLDAFGGDDGGSASQPSKTSLSSPAKSAVLLLQLGSEDMQSFLQAIAPLVAASRRTRSRSRISVTEPLPLYEAPQDPAPFMASSGTRASSCATTVVLDPEATAAEAVSEHPTPRLGGGGGVEMVPPPQDRRRGADPALLGDDEGTSEGGDTTLKRMQHKTTHNASDGQPQQQQPLRSTDGALRVHATPPPPPVHPHETMESVEEALAELVEDTQFPSGQETRAAQPLKRAGAYLAHLSLNIRDSPPPQKKGRGRGRGGQRGRPPARTRGRKACPSTCPSLASTAAPEITSARAGPAEEGGDGHGPLNGGSMAGAGEKRGHAQRHVVAHLCASDGGSVRSPNAACLGPDVADALPEATQDTVATVSYEGDVLTTKGLTRVQEAMPEEAEGTGAGEGRKGGNGAAAAATAAHRTALKGSATDTTKQVASPETDKMSAPPHGVLDASPSMSSIALGDLLASKGISSSVRTAAAVGTTRTGPRPSIAFDRAVDAAGAHAAKPARPAAAAAAAALSDAQVRRDVKSYLLDLFPASMGKPKAAPLRKAGKGVAAAPGDPATAPRKRGRPSKAKPTAAQPPDAAVPPPSLPPPTETERAAAVAAKPLAEMTAAVTKAHRTAGGKRSRSADASEATAQRPWKLRSSPASADVQQETAEWKLEPPAAGNVVEVAVATAASSTAAPRTASRVCDARALGLVQTPRTNAGDEPPQGVHSADTQARRRASRAQQPEAALSQSPDKDRGAAGSSPGGEATDAAGSGKRTADKKAAECATAPADATGDALRLTEAHRHHLVPDGEATTGRAAGDGRWQAAEVGSNGGSSSSKATCPLFYRRDSRKERVRRVLRYMNVISQSLAALHETHDELRGLLLSMLNESQL